jgi:endonuclease/exonuclease/phosphatase family metal-dependent hydrolase
MFYRLLISICTLWISAGVSAQIRVMSYNTAQFKGDANAMAEVLQEASADDSHGFAVPVSIFLFQEVDEEYLSTLQSVVGVGYTMATFTDQNDSSFGGAQAMFYNATQFVENTSLHEDIFTGASRHADRWALNVLGYASKRIYVYSMHLKASTGTTNQETRRQGAESVRDDIMTLPAESHIIMVGDMNFYSQNEPAYNWFIAAGVGELVDPLGNGNSWSGDSNALKHTQSPLLNQNGGLIGGGLDDRFDFQFVSPSMFDGGGFDLINGTYRSLGNDGNHYNGAINSGNNTYFPGDTARGNVLADKLIIASDHLPLIADYQVPAVLGWDWNPAEARVLVGANTSIAFEIRNDAPVVHTLGADELNVEIVATGDLSGSTNVSVPALSTPEIVSLPIDTTQARSWSATVTLTSTSPETQTTPEVVQVEGNVIAHANASFEFANDLDWFTYDIAFDANTGVQAFDVWLFNFGFDGSQSLLEIDDVSVPELPILFNGLSTNVVGSLPALMEFSIDTDATAPAIYTSFLPISFSDEDLEGEQTGVSMLTVRVEVIPAEGCAADFDGDGEVDVADILVLIADWEGTDPAHDLDGNGTVGVSDLLILIAAWGPCA